MQLDAVLVMTSRDFNRPCSSHKQETDVHGLGRSSKPKTSTRMPAMLKVVGERGEAGVVDIDMMKSRKIRGGDPGKKRHQGLI